MVLGEKSNQEKRLKRHEPQETEEMRPQWFSIDEIPFDEMWPDDRYWFPWFLKQQKFHGKFSFDHDGKLVDQHIESLTL